MTTQDDNEYFARAQVTFTFEVSSEGHWSGTATAAEVMRIGGRETINMVENALTKEGIKFRNVKPPKVGLISWSRKDD